MMKRFPVLGLSACLAVTAIGLSPTSLAAANGTVWSVEGKDARGNYTGQIEFIPDGNGFRFVRVIDYGPSVVAEDQRGLSWVWQGRAAPAAGGGYTLQAALQKADFITRWGGVVRTAADKVPAAVIGQFLPAKQTATTLQGSFTILQPGETAAQEIWSSSTPGAADPIFQLRVTESPTHNVIPKTTLDSLFRSYASFHQLPEVQSYVNKPEFRNPIHTAISDRTDFEYYREHPDRLRVVDKVIDPISVHETLIRADAYRASLGAKADYFDQAMADKAIDPATGLVFEYVETNGKGLPSHDAALWTGAYMASQYLRHQVTGEQPALWNIARSAQGILTLLEITGDPTVFARTLRQAQGNPVEPWVAGRWPYARLEWKRGGNNDMFKGIMLGLTTAQAALCDQPTGNDALCQRIKDASVRIVQKLKEAQGNTYNRLAALWLSAYTTREPVLITAAKKEWGRQAFLLSMGGTTFYSNGTADWSGTHLSAVQYLLFNLLSTKQPLPNVDTRAVLRRGVEATYRSFARMPMGLWGVIFAKLGTIPHADSANQALWRLREVPAPKTQVEIDHRISADYVMSPFPSAPWKNDWTKNERTQSLRSYPLFEASTHTVYAWKQSPLEYKARIMEAEFPGADYLLAYWLGRSLGVLNVSD